jgi:hypothetical protein
MVVMLYKVGRLGVYLRGNTHVHFLFCFFYDTHTPISITLHVYVHIVSKAFVL